MRTGELYIGNICFKYAGEDINMDCFEVVIDLLSEECSGLEYAELISLMIPAEICGFASTEDDTCERDVGRCNDVLKKFGHFITENQYNDVDEYQVLDMEFKKDPKYGYPT